MLDSLFKIIAGVALIAAAAWSGGHPYVATDLTIVIGLLLLIEGALRVIEWW